MGICAAARAKFTPEFLALVDRLVNVVAALGKPEDRTGQLVQLISTLLSSHEEAECKSKKAQQHTMSQVCMDMCTCVVEQLMELDDKQGRTPT